VVVVEHKQLGFGSGNGGTGGGGNAGSALLGTDTAGQLEPLILVVVVAASVELIIQPLLRQKQWW
jgi:hypothetical protein